MFKMTLGDANFLEAGMSSEKILIVDDDEEFSEELKEMLQDSGYEPYVVSESVAAVNRAREIRPKLILLDLKMAAMSGFEVADELKRFSETSAIPIIGMSGFYTIDDRSWLMNFCGFEKFFKKPFSPSNMLTEIEKTLEKNK